MTDAGQYGGERFGVGPQAWQSRLARANARAGFMHAGRAAGQQAMGAARTLGGNTLGAARAGANAASNASARGFGQAAAINAQMAQQQAQAEQQRQEMERQRGQRMLGGLLSSAGGLVGTLMPGLGTLAGAGAGVLGGAMQQRTPTAQSPVWAPQGAPMQQGETPPEQLAAIDRYDMTQFDPVTNLDPRPSNMGSRPLGAVDSALALQPPGAVSEEEWRRRLLGGG